MTERYDVAVIGAGAAGMMCAAVAAQRGRRVVLIDHASRLAEKIRISGGGRCNFTNTDTGPANFISKNPHFCRSALSRYTPRDFLELLKRYGIAWHEKHKGQLFCDRSSEDIIAMLKAECDVGGVQWRMPSKVKEIGRVAEAFRLATDAGEMVAESLVIATGGLSIPKIGATDFAYRIAGQFNVDVIQPAPALVPLTFDDSRWQPFVPLAGVSLPIVIATGEKKAKAEFREDLLFTHRGLSGPGVLQISTFWEQGKPLMVDLLPDTDLAEQLIADKALVRRNLSNHLASLLPARLAEGLLTVHGFDPTARLADLPDKHVRRLGDLVNRWSIVPSGTEGYRKAEVTRGGIDTRALSQQSMMVNAVPGLYFVGEAVDVTGWLGGYNFQWAWASGVAAGKSA